MSNSVVRFCGKCKGEKPCEGRRCEKYDLCKRRWEKGEDKYFGIEPDDVHGFYDWQLAAKVAPVTVF